MMKHRLVTKALLLMVALVLVAHLALSSPATAMRFFWLLRRYEGCDSSSELWRSRVLQCSSLVETVRQTVPPEGRIFVDAADQEIGSELAFYGFPRRVVLSSLSGEKGEVLILRQVGPGLWKVSPKSADER
jgi:hypothetical protein